MVELQSGIARHDTVPGIKSLMGEDSAPASGDRGRTHSKFDGRIMRLPPEFARGGDKQIAGLPDRARERPQDVAAEPEAFFGE